MYIFLYHVISFKFGYAKAFAVLGGSIFVTKMRIMGSIFVTKIRIMVHLSTILVDLVYKVLLYNPVKHVDEWFGCPSIFPKINLLLITPEN